MNEFIYRLILSALALMLFYGIYRLLLNKFALLNAGRSYLIVTMLLALLILLPWQRLMEIPAEIAFVVNLDMTTVMPAAGYTESSATYEWWHLAFMVYLVPAVFLLMFLIFSNLRLMFGLRHGEILKSRNVRIIILERKMLPFSWFGRIVMSRKDYEGPHAESIITHELAHIRQHHFMDLLLVEILIVFQWFNPATWQYRASLRDVHEYLADKKTIQSGFGINEYQRLLATLAGAVTAGIVSNNIKHSTLKNRFIMMTKTNNGKPATLKLAIAIVAVMLTGFGVFISACQTGSKKVEPGTTEREIIDIPLDQITVEEQTSPEKSEKIFVVVEDMPRFMGGDEARIKYLSENIRYPKEAKEKGIQGTVFVTFVVEADGSVSDVRLLRGIGGGCDEEAMRVIGNMPKWIPGRQKGQAVHVQFTMPIRFSLN